MRFVAVKGPEQQSVLMLHRTRELLVRQRTMLVTAIRAHMAEFGIVAPVGIPRVKELLAVIADAHDDRLPPVARTCLEALARQYLSLHDEITAAEKRIHAWHRSNETSRRLETIPGIGPITTSALAASITDPALFKSSRELAAWIGAGAAAERERRQAAPGADIQAGGPIPAMAAGRRRHEHHLAGQAARHDEPALACGPDGQETDQGCGRGPSQQDRPHGLGRPYARGDLPASSSIGAETADQSSTVWRGEREVMQNRSNRGSGKPVWVRAHQARACVWDPIQRIALGPAVMKTASTGRTHDCTRPICINVKTTLAKGEPSTHDPMQPSVPGAHVCCKFAHSPTRNLCRFVAAILKLSSFPTGIEASHCTPLSPGGHVCRPASQFEGMLKCLEWRLRFLLSGHRHLKPLNTRKRGE